MTLHPPPGPAAVPRPRRIAAGLALAGCVAVLAAACTHGGPGPVPDGLPGPVPVQLPPNAEPLQEPMEITSHGGVLDVTVAAVFRSLAVPRPFKGTTPVVDTMVLRTYQVMRVVRGRDTINYADSAKYGFPGPTLRVLRGDSVHIVLQNRMYDTTTAPANPAGGTSNERCAAYPAAQPPRPTDRFEDCFHGANWTNIHYHGMHVTPDTAGDDVLLLIPPGTDYEYGFRIPHNQSPGTHWYHPHKHGSVAIQVLNGMSGALIVDGGPLDSLTRAHHIRERLIALQQIDTLPNLFSATVFGQDFVVNGQATPVIIMAPGEVQRWRIVNENVTKTNNFEILIADGPGDEPGIYEVARDGVQYANANYAPHGVPLQDTTVLMSPGNRLDLFVRAPGAGGLYAVQTRLVAHGVPHDQTRKERLVGRPRHEVQALASAAGQAALPNTGHNNVFYVLVDSTLPRTQSRLPSSLPPLPGFLANLPGPLNPDSILADSVNVPVIVFADSGFGAKNHINPTEFFLGTAQNPRMQFNSAVTYVPVSATGKSRPMVLDSVQTWKVVNISQATNHPFHIHINPFQVVDAFYPNPNDPNAALYADLDHAAQVQRAPIWLDVVPLPLPRIDTLRADTIRSSTGRDSIINVRSADTTAGYVLIRQEYQPFVNADGTPCANCGDPTGWFVMHCHILGHEERGMMQVLEIVETGEQPSPPPAWYSSAHGHTPAQAQGQGQGHGHGHGAGQGHGHGHGTAPAAPRPAGQPPRN